MGKKQNTQTAKTIAEHLETIRELVLDADILIQKARQEASAIKRLTEEKREKPPEEP